MKNRSGFTLLELLISVAVSGIVIATSSFVLHQLFAENKSLETWSSGQFEISMALRELEADVRNIVRLDPAETGPQTYLGLMSVPIGAEPNVCRNSTSASVIRFTTLDRRKRAEMLLRAWSELDHSGGLQPEDELRVTASGSRSSLFQSQSSPAEVVLVDADRRSLRRYEVSRSEMRLNATRDPYDDLPKTDAFGNARVFNYASAFLRNPRTIQGALIPPITAVSITGSEVYGVHTWVVCLRRSDGALIKVGQVTGEEKVLLTNPIDEFEIQSFQAAYMGTRRGLRVEPDNFETAMIPANAECINTISLQVNLVAGAAHRRRNEQLLVKEQKESITQRRVIFSPNLNTKRHVRCDP